MMKNEKRLIDANAFIEAFENADADVCEEFFGGADWGFSYKAIRELVQNIPTVDAVEVVHGRWEPHYETFEADPAIGVRGGNCQTGWQCSVCGRYECDKEPYCNCGAKMDGRLNDE